MKWVYLKRIVQLVSKCLSTEYETILLMTVFLLNNILCFLFLNYQAYGIFNWNVLSICSIWDGCLNLLDVFCRHMIISLSFSWEPSPKFKKSPYYCAELCEIVKSFLHCFKWTVSSVSDKKSKISSKIYSFLTLV